MILRMMTRQIKSPAACHQHPSKNPSGAGQNTQFADYRAAGRFSAPRGETLLLFPPRHSKPFMASKRARAEPRGIGSGCEAHSARTRHNTTCIKQGYKTSAKPKSPWSPSQAGAQGQGSSACRGTPSRGEARALHHQPVPALTLTMSCIL